MEVLLRMKDLAPDIFRQRLIIEGYWGIAVDDRVVRDYLTGLAGAVGLTAYGEPIVFSPASGEGRPENAGYDAFLPLIDSGISGYFWSASQFLSVVLYSCTPFDTDAAVAYTRKTFEIEGEIEQMTF